MRFSQKYPFLPPCEIFNSTSSVSGFMVSAQCDLTCRLKISIHVPILLQRVIGFCDYFNESMRLGNCGMTWICDKANLALFPLCGSAREVRFCEELCCCEPSHLGNESGSKCRWSKLFEITSSYLSKCSWNRCPLNCHYKYKTAFF